jgi:hypothetical protein
MRLRPLRWPTLVALVALVACATVKKGPGPKEKRGARQRRSELRFSHALHAEQEIGCDTCHAKLNQAGDLGRRHSPSKATCADCHEVKDKQACTTCHPDPRRARKLGQRPPSPGLIFSHRAHGKRVKECITCHAGAAVAKSLTAVPRPKMRGDCFACHNHLTDYRHMRCKRCHDRLSHHPIKVVSTFSHAGNFLKEHGRWARTSADLCGSCHQQSYCADCHSQRATVLPSVKLAERTDRRFIHRGDWISRHAAQSRADPGRCTKCHSEKRCASCHKARGIHAGSSTARGRTPHPPGWLSPGSPNSHGLQARRRITQCAGCHDRGALSNCVRCHKSIARGGLGVRPHPPGWSRGSKRGHRVCLVCH